LYTPNGFGAGGKVNPSFAKFSSGVLIKVFFNYIK
jgi:hypothetical protein